MIDSLVGDGLGRVWKGGEEEQNCEEERMAFLLMVSLRYISFQ
jgi:hypothetical protein